VKTQTQLSFHAIMTQQDTQHQLLETPKKVKKVDFISEILSSGENKIGEYFGKDVEVDHDMIHRRLVALNIPALSVIVMGAEGQYSFEEECESVFREQVLVLYEGLSKDSCEDIRAVCA
jgi:hypothetical protein